MKGQNLPFFLLDLSIVVLTMFIITTLHDPSILGLTMVIIITGLRKCHDRVVLHDALKSKELVGLCAIGEGWFGVISAWSQKTETEKVVKQSNLCLSIIGTMHSLFILSYIRFLKATCSL